MASLTRVVLTPNTWSDISTEMVSGRKYRISNTYDQNVIAIAETSGTPSSTTSAITIGGLESVDWAYDGTAVYARPRAVDQIGTLGVDIVQITET